MLPKKISRTIHVNEIEWRYAVFSNEIVVTAKNINIKLKYKNSCPVLPSHIRKLIDLHSEGRIDLYSFEDIVNECISECDHNYKYTRLRYIYKEELPNYPKERLSPTVSRRCSKCQAGKDYVVDNFDYISDYEKNLFKGKEALPIGIEIEILDYIVR